MNISLFHLCLEIAQWLLIVALLAMLLNKRLHARILDKGGPVFRSNYDESRNSISFLGGFCVRNRNGEDISSQFSPILRRVLVALVVYSAEDTQGVWGERLDSLIWGYKPDGTASNNRNVYLSRLRKALQDVDGVSISTRNQMTSISFDSTVSCDYIEMIRLYRTEGSFVDVDKLLSILLKGEPFTNMNDDWLKAFKDDFSTATVAYLSQLLSSEALSGNVRLKISEIIVRYDKLNEPALRTRCRINNRQGNLSLAKEIYEQYRRDYKEFIGEEYHQSFKGILSI